MTSGFSVMDTTSLIAEIVNLKAQIKSMKGWLQSLPQGWVDNDFEPTQQMIQNMKDWLVELPSEWMDQPPLNDQPASGIRNDSKHEDDDVQESGSMSNPDDYLADTVDVDVKIKEEKSMQANHISSLDDNLLIVKVEETDRGEIDFASRDFSPEGASDTDVSMQGDQSGSLDDDMLIVKVDQNDIAEEEDNGEADFASDNIFVEGAVETGLDVEKKRILRPRKPGKETKKTEALCAFEGKELSRKKRRSSKSANNQRKECSICHKLVVNLNRHSKTHGERSKFTCDVCNKDLSSARVLSDHMKRRHGTGEFPHLCSTCGKRFLIHYELEAHMKRHSGEKKVICPECGKSFVANLDLRIHMRTHSSERWECKLCGKFYKSPSLLALHKKAMHEAEGSFECEVCSKPFANRKRFKRHVQQHNKDASHVCSYCGRGFKDMSYLKNHTRTHTGEKPYECHECGKHFRKMGQLSRHSIIHKGLKPHKCSVCEKGFNQLCNMKTHMKTHHSHNIK